MLTQEEVPDLEDLHRRLHAVRDRISQLEGRLSTASGDDRTRIQEKFREARKELEGIGGELALLAEHAPMREASAAVHAGTTSTPRS